MNFIDQTKSAKAEIYVETRKRKKSRTPQ